MDRRFWRIVTAVTVWHVAASVCYYAVYAGTPLFRDAFALSAWKVEFVDSPALNGRGTAPPRGCRFGVRKRDPYGRGGVSAQPARFFSDSLWKRLRVRNPPPNYPLLLTAAVLLGSMYGSATPGTNKAIFDRIDAGLQHRAIGIKQVGPTVGSAAGALLVTGLAGLYFRQAGFLAAAGIGLAVAVAFGAAYRGATRDAGAYPDFRGLVSNRTFVVLLASGVCLGAVFYTTTGYTVLFVEESIGATVAVGGLVLAAVQIAGSAGKVVAGVLADVLPGAPQTRTSAILSVQAAAGGVLYLALPRVETPLAAGAVFVVLGVSVLGASGLYYSCLSTLVADERLGAASAAGQLAVTASGLFAPPAFGYLVDAVGYWAGWGLLAGLSFLAAGFGSLVALDLV
jgi:Arabinose efflux permease